MGFARHFFFSGNRQEVNSIEEPIKSREKHYLLVLYILNDGICGLLPDGTTVTTRALTTTHTGNQHWWRRGFDSEKILSRDLLVHYDKNGTLHQ